MTKETVLWGLQAEGGVNLHGGVPSRSMRAASMLSFPGLLGKNNEILLAIFLSSGLMEIWSLWVEWGLLLPL
jgi:hypothetical protein